jgi:PAS domain-containing protein
MDIKEITDINVTTDIKETTPDEPTFGQPIAVCTSDKANAVVAQYRDIAAAAMDDAKTWLRKGALSRAIAEAMPDAVLVADESGIIISVNSQFELMFGYHRSEVIGKTPECWCRRPPASAMSRIAAAISTIPRFGTCVRISS